MSNHRGSFTLRSDSMYPQMNTRPTWPPPESDFDRMIRLKHASCDDDDWQPPAKRFKPYVTRNYMPEGGVVRERMPDVGPFNEYLDKVWQRPLWLITPDRPPRRVNTSDVMLIQEEMDEDIEWKNDFPEVTPLPLGVDRPMDDKHEDVPQDKVPEAQKVHDAAADTDVVMGDSSSTVPPPDVTMVDSSSATSASSPQAVESTSPQAVSASVTVDSAAPQAASLTNEPMQSEPAKASPLPIIAFDETASNDSLKPGDLDGRPRVPCERKWQKPGPSPLSQVVTLDVAVPVDDCKSRFNRPRFWTPYLEPGELPDGTWTSAPPPPPWASCRGQYIDYDPYRPRPPHKDRVRKLERDLRVAPPLQPQLTRRRMFAASLRHFNLTALWKARAPEFRIMFREAGIHYFRACEKDKSPPPKYDCDTPRPPPSKGTPSGLKVPHPLRPRLARPPRTYKLRPVTKIMPWDRISGTGKM